MPGRLTATHEGFLEGSEGPATFCAVRLKLVFREVAKVISVLRSEDVLIFNRVYLFKAICVNIIIVTIIVIF